MKITALAGGTGAAKLLRGLARVVDPRDLTVIVNTGDDTEIWGLHVSPDLDTVCYTLGGVIDERKGWGLTDETFHALDQIARFGEPVWFNLGDRDLATHLHRTRLLREGRTLTQITRAIAQALGVAATVLPMSDQPVRTRILGPDGWLAFQEYFVREKAQVEVRAVQLRGGAGRPPRPGRPRRAPHRRRGPGLPLEPDHLDRSRSWPCPGSSRRCRPPTPPWPRSARSWAATRYRVRPAGSWPRPAFPVSATGVARAYGGWLDLLVFDEQDRALAPEIRSAGAAPVAAPTMMSSREAEVTLARHVVTALEAARAAR